MPPLWALAAFAFASPPDDIGGSPSDRASGPAALDGGDAAWFAQRRGEARRAWADAARSGDPATRAMAEMRMLLVSGNLGLALHGPRAERALAACPAIDPRCALARADYQLLLREIGFASDAQEIDDSLRFAESALPGPVAARRVWAGERPAASLEPADRDGLGDGLLASGGRWPRGPGTWFLTLGLLGAPGLGVGGAVRFDHPDVAWAGWKLGATAAATSRGFGDAQVAAAGPGALWWGASASGTHAVVDLYAPEPSTTEAWIARAAIGPGVRSGAWSAWVGPVARIDREVGAAGPLDGHGAAAWGAWDRRAAVGEAAAGAFARISSEVALADYTHEEAAVDLRAYAPAMGGLVAVRALGAAAPGSEAPPWRLPEAGGTDVLRGAPVGRYRGEWLGAGAVEWRRGIVPALEGVLFVEAAWVASTGEPTEPPHPAGGAGIHFLLPPRPLHVVRLDVAASDAGWGVVTAWGEAF